MRSIRRRNRRNRLASTSQRVQAGALCGLAVLLATLPLAASPSPVRSSAAIVPISGEINDIVRDSISRRIDEARAAGAGTIIFEMDTPGGAVTSALDICRLIKALPAEVRTVAWVNPDAYSAGAMISVACNEIWMAERSSIGDCAPIMVTPQGVDAPDGTVRAKVEGPILEEFRDSARKNGYDPLLSRAMVVTETEVWWIESIADGTRRFVEGEEKKRLIDDEKEPQWRLVASFKNYRGEETPVEQPIDRKDGLLTLSQTEAVAYGFARGIANSADDLARELQLVGPAKRLDFSGWENFALWLNSPIVRGILFVLVIVGGYVEFQHFGLIVPGVVAVVALAIFLGAPYAAGLANVWTFILLGIGLLLLGVEIFILPGFGIAGILGIAAILISVVGTFVPAEPGLPTFTLPTLQGTWTALKTGVVVVSGSIIAGIIGILLVMRFLPQLPIGRQLMLNTPDGRSLALADPHPDVALVGDIGVVVGTLRPAGHARFGTEVIEVQSQGEYVETGTRVQVLKREGMTITVRPLPADAPTA